jgi:hypothetical protein
MVDKSIKIKIGDRLTANVRTYHNWLAGDNVQIAECRHLDSLMLHIPIYIVLPSSPPVQLMGKYMYRGSYNDVLQLIS